MTRLPNGVFSGKENLKPGIRAVFFCYARPALDKVESAATGKERWTEEAGDVRWYLFDVQSGKIIEDGPQIVQYIRSLPEPPRKTVMDQTTLSEVRNTVETHIRRSYLRKVQAPAGVEATLKSWMELN